MSGMQNFVKSNRNGRAGSPQNGQPPVNPQRQTIAANARVPMKASIARPQTAQELRVRGESIAQHQSVPVQQQQSKQRPSGEGRKRDPWDTDAESIDTTINHSVVQVEDNRQHEQQQLQRSNEESDAGGDEASIPDELGDEEDVKFGEEVEEYLAHHDLADATSEAQMQFLRKTQPQLFTTVDGDSYPTTTDGNPTEWDEQQEPRFADFGLPPLSPDGLHQRTMNATFPNQQPLQHQASSGLHANSALPQNRNVWQQGAQIRGQQRNDSASQARRQSGQQHNTAHPLTSQTPSYNQATNEHHFVVSPVTHAPVEANIHGGQSNLPRKSSRISPGPGRTPNPIPRIMEPTYILRQASTTPAQVVPTSQHVASDLVIESPVFADGDYDPEVLSKMEYNHLRDESFDKNPRKRDSILSEEMRKKPLPERLQFAQRELNPAAQAEFFSALPMHEWEDAGDWFLDQFSAIIKRTREARQKKRHAAEGFEQEIDLRHQHIAKKQRLVEGAMTKMKAQGEGLVPKSPRAPKRP